MSSLPNLVTMGSCTLDCIIKIKDVLRFELLDEERVKKYTAIEYSKKLNIDDVRFFEGGSAANIASDCAMIGLNSAYLGVIGNDFSAKMCLDDLKSRNVDISHIIQTEKDNTAFSVILKSPWGKDRSILAYKGANNLIEPSDVDEDFMGEVKAFAWTSLTKENSCKAIEKAIKITKDNTGRVYGAPSMSIIKNNPKWAEKLIGLSDIVSLNLQEAKEVTKQEGIMKIIQKFKDMGVEIISITNGSDGSIISDGKQVIHNSIYQTKVQDTTGSGDAYMSGLILADMRDKSLEKMAQYGSAMGALESTEMGVREGLPKSFEELESFIKNNSLEQVKSSID
ncbi:MAG: carbohydrate kinase family protein [Promethearchaeota archaeon]|nr:MAG: carbohydrate kinase family protein [Candidatus Lokiarchaeota archaeon]